MNWAIIPFASKYEASDGGQVRNKKTGHILTPRVDMQQEYPRVGISLNDGTYKKMMVHVLVMAAFRGEKPYGMEIDHINCDRTDSRLENLRYVTPEENRANPRTVLNNKIGNIKRLVKIWSISKDEGERRIKEALREYGTE